MRKTEEYNIDLKDENPKLKKKPKKKDRLGIFDVFSSIVAALTVVTMLFLFCFRVFDVDGPSMVPTLEDGEKVIVSTVGYKPQRGDVVVISKAGADNKPIVKRVIAVGGDTVNINLTTGVVTVNGVEEHYSDDLTNQTINTAYPMVVPEGTVFVLGDNRELSHDSRYKIIGCIDERLIVGKVVMKLSFGDWSVE
jgi:signal peptidase I